jgi:hypothetical protein
MSSRQAAKRTVVAKAPSRQRSKAERPPVARAVRAPVDDDDAGVADDYEDGEGALGESDDEDGLGLPPLDDRDPKSALREDPALDRRIIEGMLRDRKILLEELAQEGMTQAAVLRRAAELGLSEALLRQVKGVAADLAGERPGRRAAPSTLGARTCLSCDRVFLSTGPGNRLCMRCRGGDAGLAQF